MRRPGFGRRASEEGVEIPVLLSGRRRNEMSHGGQCLNKTQERKEGNRAETNTEGRGPRSQHSTLLVQRSEESEKKDDSPNNMFSAQLYERVQEAVVVFMYDQWF